MGYWRWLGKKTKDFIKFAWYDTILKLMIPGIILSFSYLILLIHLNNWERTMKSPYFELSFLVFPMLLLSILLPILYEIYLEGSPCKKEGV